MGVQLHKQITGGHDLVGAVNSYFTVCSKLCTSDHHLTFSHPCHPRIPGVCWCHVCKWGLSIGSNASHNIFTLIFFLQQLWK